MWGETVSATRSTGTNQLALSSTLDSPAGRRNSELNAEFQWIACSPICPGNLGGKADVTRHEYAFCMEDALDHLSED